MFTIWKLTVASVKMFVRNKQAVFFTFFSPIFLMVIFGVIGVDRPQTIDVGVVLQGSLNAPTQEFLYQISEIPILKLHYGSEKFERKELEDGNRAVVMFLNNNPFSDQGVPGTLSMLRNEGDPEAQIVVSTLNQFINQASLRTSGVSPLVDLKVEDVNVTNLRYIDFLLPGLVALSVMQLAVFSVAFFFVDYKEKGILKRVLATPVKPYQFITANIVTRLAISLIQTVFFIAMGVLVFNIQIIGSYWLIALVVFIGSLMFLALGFIISGLASTTESVPAIANIIVFPMMFLGGTFFAIESMPAWLSYIAKALPLTYFSEALREVMTKGAGIQDIFVTLLIMVGWVVALVYLATYVFSFEEKKL